MIPGPIGKIGTGLWLLGTVGSSLYALKKKKQAAQGIPESQAQKKATPLSRTRSFKNLFSKPGTNTPAKNDHNLYYNISVTQDEAQSGAKKQISYQIGENSENLQVTIPPGISSGNKLRLREKGSIVNQRRGDLILTIQVQS